MGKNTPTFPLALPHWCWHLWVLGLDKRTRCSKKSR